MRFYLLFLFLLAFTGRACAAAAKVDVVTDNEFAEFEDEETEGFVQPAKPQTPAPSEDVPVPKKNVPVKHADEFDEDYGVMPEDEGQKDDGELSAQPGKVEPLKFTDVPAHFRSNWASYQVEAVVLFIIAVYLVNYVIGRSQNHAVASEWFDNVKDILQEQFALVGDDGVGESLVGGHLLRDTDYSYSVWCSGRIGVRGLLAQLRTVKRQDLMSRIMSLFSPQNDKLTLKFELDAGEVDSFVFAVGQKKTTTRQAKDMLDLNTYAPEKKNLTQFSLPANYTLFSESSEATSAVFDLQMAGLIRKHEKAIEYIHVSDQYSGPKPPDGETYTRMPDVVHLVQVTLNMDECSDKETQLELLQLVIYLVDKVRRVRLSKEAKAKSTKRRLEVEEAFMKMTHQMRQEAAQARREEKTRERKQRMLDEEDPDKQRRLEMLEMKREAKAKQPKMKAMKMKM